jgi:hypothetical protein
LKGLSGNNKVKVDLTTLKANNKAILIKITRKEKVCLGCEGKKLRVKSKLFIELVVQMSNNKQT